MIILDKISKKIGTRILFDDVSAAKITSKIQAPTKLQIKKPKRPRTNLRSRSRKILAADLSRLRKEMERFL